MNVQEIQLLPAHRLSEMIQNREISCLEFTNTLLEKIEKENDNLNTFLYINDDGAREMAKKVDEMVSKKEFTKPLLGIPISVPDALNMLNRPTTFGSLLLQDHIAVDDAIEIEQLKNAGSIILGKTNMAEFGLHYETANRLRGPCRNPLNTQFSSGGGSGGSAASVASGQATIALATDSNGSLRLTSSFCGLPGLMPTRGRIPFVRKHILPFTEQMFYRKGIIARDVEDIAMMLSVLSRPDDRDPICCCFEPGDYIAATKKKPEHLKIAWSPNLDILSVDPEVAQVTAQAVKKLEELGHSVEEVKLGLKGDYFHHFRNLIATDRYILIMKLLEKHPGGSELLAEYTPQWLMIGDKITGVQYSLGQAFSGWLKMVFDDLFERYDLLVTPTVPVPPFPIGKAPKSTDDPLVGLWGFLLPFNMSGHPAMSLPCGKSKDGLPIGFQLVGKYLEEETLLSLAKAYEETI